MNKLVVETALRFLHEEGRDEKIMLRFKLANALDLDKSFVKIQKKNNYCRPKTYCEVNGIEIPCVINECNRCMICYIYIAKEIIKRNCVKYD